MTSSLKEIGGGKGFSDGLVYFLFFWKINTDLDRKVQGTWVWRDNAYFARIEFNISAYGKKLPWKRSTNREFKDNLRILYLRIIRYSIYLIIKYWIYFPTWRSYWKSGEVLISCECLSCVSWRLQWRAHDRPITSQLGGRAVAILSTVVTPVTLHYARTRQKIRIPLPKIRIRSGADWYNTTAR